jgi:parallel beta-helix repeat protein
MNRAPKASSTRALAVLLLASAVSRARADDVFEIGNSLELDPSKTYGAIRITASDITVDGRGASLVGAKDGDPKTFEGVGISAKGVSRVVLRDVKVKGFETGLRIEDGEGWTIEGCDFSDNFHDPEFGWGENGRRGGIVLERVHRSSLRKNRANRVWDGCVLVGSSDNVIEENDFSRT